MAARKDPWDSFTKDAESRGFNPRATCSVCMLIEKLPEEGRTVVERALRRPDLSANAIRKALLSRVTGTVVPSESSFRRHRRGECEKGQGK